MKKITDYYKRGFLNKPGIEQGAYIIAEISRESWNKPLDFYRESYIKMSDCNRIIELDFNIDDNKSAKNSLAKIDLLAEIFTNFKKELHKQADLAKKERVIKAVKEKKDKIAKKKEDAKKKEEKT